MCDGIDCYATRGLRRRQQDRIVGRKHSIIPSVGRHGREHGFGEHVLLKLGCF
jgi:hypothetical protein